VLLVSVFTSGWRGVEERVIRMFLDRSFQRITCRRNCRQTFGRGRRFIKRLLDLLERPQLRCRRFAYTTSKSQRKNTRPPSSCPKVPNLASPCELRRQLRASLCRPSHELLLDAIVGKIRE